MGFQPLYIGCLSSKIYPIRSWHRSRRYRLGHWLGRFSRNGRYWFGHRFSRNVTASQLSVFKQPVLKFALNDKFFRLSQPFLRRLRQFAIAGHPDQFLAAVFADWPTVGTKRRKGRSRNGNLDLGLGFRDFSKRLGFCRHRFAPPIIPLFREIATPLQGQWLNRGRPLKIFSNLEGIQFYTPNIARERDSGYACPTQNPSRNQS